MLALSSRREAFYERIQELQALGAAQALGHWDMQTHMPSQAANTRAQTLSALGALAHERLTDPAFGDAIQALLDTPSDDATETALLAEMAYRRNRALSVSPQWVRQFETASARGYGIWADARRDNDFAAFLPALQELVTLSRQRAEILSETASGGNLYDALLEDYERGATVAEIDPLFDALHQELVPLAAQIADQQQPEPDCFEGKSFDLTVQTAFCRETLTAMGYDFTRGRMDASAHPFTTEIGGRNDVRLTIRSTTAHPLESVFTALHEGGHALYEQGVDPALADSPLGTGTSLGIHESQSRLWENAVGRSAAFWRHFYPRLQAVFPQALGDVDEDVFLRRVNRVTPSLIRTEADEVTYNLHILLRYRLEKALISGSLAPAEIPEAWNAGMTEFLGVEAPNDAHGCLQDVHWSGGSFGYFPTYTLGNLYAAQFYHTARQQMPDLDARLSQGDLLTLKNWLNQHIHVFGKTRTAQALALSVTGEALSPQYFLDALRQKYLSGAV
ncbi:MAG: carboxypeptidase M32 [Vampirovibrionales bacterium]|nr:carboxypeptidase M32 [Vampirovibrionales bacterium]